jgi:hypothetical protein
MAENELYCRNLYSKSKTGLDEIYAREISSFHSQLEVFHRGFIKVRKYLCMIIGPEAVAACAPASCQTE